MDINKNYSSNPIISLFLNSSNLFGNSIALQYEKEEYSYTVLCNKVVALGEKLKNIPDEVIAVSTSRSIDAIIALLAVMYSGKAYLPLDAKYPVSRLQTIIEDAGVKMAFYPVHEKDIFGEQLNLSHIYELVEENNIQQGNEPAKNITYLLYTSGSTGVPKGVCMGSAALENLIVWQNKNSFCGYGTKTLQFSPWSFDVSFQEIFATLTTGGTLVLIDDNQRLNPVGLLQFIEEHQINRIFLPFVALQLLAEAGAANKQYPHSLKEIMTAGEQLKITPQLRAFFAGIPDCRLFNQYGPTECHVVSQLLLEGASAIWPELPSIGTAIDNVSVFIINKENQLVPVGAEGELCISGICLAEGYVKLPQLTQEKFQQWLHPEKGLIKIYRTGDIARENENGGFDFLGRKDDQVKIRGYRIEIGEVEAALNNLKDVKQAVVKIDKDMLGQNRMLAYIMSDKLEKDLALRKQLAGVLPDYMLPSAFIVVDTFKLTPNGKIDKNALPSPSLERPFLQAPFRKPSTIVEQQVVAIWEEILTFQNIGADDNFFELGGNSLQAQRSISLLHQKHGHKLPITKFYQFSTPAAISVFLLGEEKKFKPAAAAPNKPQTNKHVAVIGMACRFPGAASINEFWDILVNGKETVHFFKQEELDPQVPDTLKKDEAYVAARGVIKNVTDFDADFFGINPVLAQVMDPQQRVFLEMAYETLETTGYLSGKYDGTIGVFAGCGNNSYYLNNVLANPSPIETIGQFQVNTVSDKDYIASRTAFQLNLKGPSVSVFSACSTSLLAVAQAAESILSGQCQMALAGGISITVPTASGHIYEEGAMLSKDGHTRSFDMDATGTVFSDGGGVVLLKALSEAEKDGDYIYAVIKGTGINNDGAEKGSFSGPSAYGQATAIAMAIQNAGVDPHDISYVEAHGTATPIGDPIEIEGLKMAFGPQLQKQFCAIGTVKSNFGHLTHAAGIAGLIKTALAMKYGLLPASINYTTANPALSLSESPFFVNNILREWKIDKKLAGISSFGVGGTNVHVLLENYKMPNFAQEDKQEDWQLVTWSARSVESASAFGENLYQYIKTNNKVGLGTVAATLQLTRKEYEVKQFAVVKDLAAWPAGNNNVLSNIATAKKDIAFVFPGQGTHYPAMGHALYQRFPAFKHALDECRGILLQQTGTDILSVLFPTETGYNPDNLQDTFYAQPALFSISYALAKCWISLGIEPAYFIGHSLGEFVAGHLAGIFNLADALKMVAERAKLVSQLPGGAMLAVRVPNNRVAELLTDEISHALTNAPNNHVFSGQHGYIEGLKEKAKSLGFPFAKVNTSHAFHSAEMDAVTTPFKKVVASVKFSPPRTPVISSVTGSYLTDGEAMSVDYWANHVRQKVDFSAAVAFAVNEANPVFLETGPGSTLSSYIKQQGNGNICAVSIRENRPEVKQLLQSLGELWQLGFKPKWNSLYSLPFQKLHDLPTYAFQRKRFWLEPEKSTAVKKTDALTLNMDTQEVLPATAETIQSGNLPVDRKIILSGKIKQIFESALGVAIGSDDEDKSFVALGIDSLLLTQLSLTLKKEFSIPISFRQLSEQLDTIQQLVIYIDNQLPPDKFTTASSVINVPIPAAAPANADNFNNTALNQVAQQLRALAAQVQQMQHNNGTAAAAILPQAKTKPAAGLVNIDTEEAAELKKPFGATARIERQVTSITKEQEGFIQQFTADYNRKTAQSKTYTQKYRSTMADPRVVTGFKPLTKEIVYPIVVSSSKGSRLRDIDGNEYIDALNGFGSNMLGYQPDVLTSAIKAQIDKGYEVGPQHELAGPVCDLICELTHFDRAALCNTGSEAVLGAIRIARTVTGRSLIVAFTGSYHGINDEVIVRGTKKLQSFPAAPGIMPEAVQNMLILDYGTPESLAIIKERASELAAVLVEPVQSRRPEFQPVAFLKMLREITAASGTVLVFDEVITGFRAHPGGTQAMFNIQADVATYGKVIGGGLPIGAIAGKKQFMDALDGGFWQFGDASVPEVGVTYFAGTFVRHPLALAAAKASLSFMKSEGKALQEKINTKTDYLVNELNAICEKEAIPVYAVHFGSLWKIKFKQEYAYSELLFALMRYKGIHIWDNFPCFLTLAHSKMDIEQIIGQFAWSVRKLIEADLIYTNNKKEPAAINTENIQTLAGAKLGLDDEGNPAWFIPDPKRLSKYLKVVVLDQKLRHSTI